MHYEPAKLLQGRADLITLKDDTPRATTYADAHLASFATLDGGKLDQGFLDDHDNAAATDDPAYAKRLREAAEGKRPLRTLLADPAFGASTGLDDLDLARHVDSLAAEQARALLPDVMELQQRAAQIIAEEETRGWGGSVERLAEQRRASGDDGPSGQEREQR